VHTADSATDTTGNGIASIVARACAGRDADSPGDHDRDDDGQCDAGMDCDDHRDGPDAAPPGTDLDQRRRVDASLLSLPMPPPPAARQRIAALLAPLTDAVAAVRVGADAGPPLSAVSGERFGTLGDPIEGVSACFA
jgi:hypothetical protein